MEHKQLTQTLKKQRDALTVEPIHATIEPVRAYALQIAKVKGEAFSVVEIPESSAAYGMGYRFASIPNAELEHYLASGARLAEFASIAQVADPDHPTFKLLVKWANDPEMQELYKGLSAGFSPELKAQVESSRVEDTLLKRPDLYLKSCGFSVIDTGGGCTAWSRSVRHGQTAWEIWVTRKDDSSADIDANSGITVGLYEVLNAGTDAEERSVHTSLTDSMSLADLPAAIAACLKKETFERYHGQI